MEKTIGIVIKCKDYSETSQLVWLYTKDFGKIKFIAKGSRGKKKQFRSKLDLFGLVDIVFYKSHKGELHTLTEYDILEPFTNVRLDLDRLATASYMAELLEVSTPLEDPCGEIFSLLVHMLKRLSEGKDPKFLRCVFEIKLLQWMGTLQNMEDQQHISKGVRAIINSIEKSKAIDKLKISKAQLDELSQLLRIIIDYSAGKRLKSLTFLNSLTAVVV